MDELLRDTRNPARAGSRAALLSPLLVIQSGQPALIALLSARAEHREREAAFYIQMANSLADVLWELITLLQMPPKPASDLAGKTVIFGSWAAEDVIARVAGLLAPENNAQVPPPPRQELPRKARRKARSAAPTGSDPTQA